MRQGHETHLRALGAEVVEAAHLSAAGEVDAILDLVGGEPAQQAWRQVKRGGIFASIVAPPSTDEAARRDARPMLISAQTKTQQLTEIAALVDKGAVRIVVARTFPLASAHDAHESLQSGGINGKVVLTVS